MSDYLPLFMPGQVFTGKASAAITGGVLVAVSGDGTLATAGAGVTSWVGVAGHDVAASGDLFPVYCGGIQRLVASGAITAGDQVITDTGGKVASLAAAAAATAADVNKAREVVGVALTTTTDDGDEVHVAMVR